MANHLHDERKDHFGPFFHLTVKVRPAACLTDEISPYKHIVIAFITSQVNNAVEISDIPVLQPHPDFLGTGLKTSSAIRLHRLVTIPTSLIQRELGVLSPAFQTEVAQKLRAMFGL
jgi:mRNA interferase MazF